ncbi:ABC transporter permease [Candidatus Dependentiae bacterium]|nr:ABC transporter permease [Candidatus Dependentiae bacterium]
MFNSRALQTTFWLLWHDIKLFLKDWHNNILDAFFWPLVLILANGYILPAMGMPEDYGSFIVISMLVIMASFTAWCAANEFAADFEGARSIGYELTLPLSYKAVFLKIILQFAFKASFFNLITLLIGKVILGSGFSFANFDILRFFLIYLIACIFFGTFAIWAAALSGNVKNFMRVELRLAGPLFFICGYAASWSIMNTVSPIIGKIMLCTPWIYAYEGVRIGVLGQTGYLNYWFCFGMLSLFIVVFGIHGLYLFKKRLDCV